MKERSANCRELTGRKKWKGRRRESYQEFRDRSLLKEMKGLHRLKGRSASRDRCRNAVTDLRIIADRNHRCKENLHLPVNHRYKDLPVIRMEEIQVDYREVEDLADSSIRN
jgi:hypothetical protein